MAHFPKHIGIIPDGNRRWARQNGLKKEDGYEYGLVPGLEVLRAAKKSGVKELTYYGFTVDNCKRPKAQFEAFSKACVKAADLLRTEDVCLYVSGNTQSECFPSELLKYTELPHNVNKNDKMRVNLLVNYGWEWDMKNNWASRDISRIDMVIRWGGMRRLSGFLPLQTVYSDIYVVEDLWPEYKDVHLFNAISWYADQDVTLGG